MRFINNTSDLSKYLGIRIENQALIKKIHLFKDSSSILKNMSEKLFVLLILIRERLLLI